MERSTMVTVYFDAAFDWRTSRSASGLIVCDTEGKIVASKSVIHFDMPSLLHHLCWGCIQDILIWRERDGGQENQTKEIQECPFFAKKVLRRGEGIRRGNDRGQENQMKKIQEDLEDIDST